MKRTLIFIFTILIISCNRTEESITEESLFEIEEENNDFQIYVDPQAIDNYKKIENASNKEFIDKLLKTISKFEDKKADTTIYQFCNIDKQLAFRMAVDWAERENVKIPKEEYANYLNDFKGDMIAFGHPESREGLFMWYEPIKMFSLFYSP
jgi:hypothetical protein